MEGKASIRPRGGNALRRCMEQQSEGYQCMLAERLQDLHPGNKVCDGGWEEWIVDVFRRKSQQDVPTLGQGLCLLLTCLPLHQAWYLDVVHGLFCFASSNICALFSYLDFSSKNCQIWKLRRKHNFSNFCLSNADFISIFMEENFLWDIMKSQF